MDQSKRLNNAVCDDSEALPRDITRFQRFTANGRAVLPKDFELKLTALTTRDLIANSAER
jgi:hypothetical protein